VLSPSMRRSVGVKWILFWLRETLFFSRRVATVAMLPSALSMSESFRSVHVGRSRFSRRCHLINDLRFMLRMKVGLALDAVTGTRLWLLSFLFLERFCLFFVFDLRGCCNCNSAVVVQGLIHFSAHPQVMQQHCQLSCRGHDGPLLAASSSSFR
jgi:hypothetical protein